MTQERPIGNRKYVVIMILVYAAWIGLYYFTAWIGSLRGPAFDAELPIDASIPYLPAVLPVYFLAYIIIPGIFLISREPAFLNRAYITIIVANAAAFLIFIVLPVLGPVRSAEPVSSSVVQWMVSLTHSADSRYNAFPSLHVVNPCLLALLSIRERGFSWITVVFVALAIAISAATMLVKQHFIIDVAGGAALALISVAVCSRLKISPRHW